MKQADHQRHKEERKIIAGYSSGRRAPELADEEGGQVAETSGDNEEPQHEEGRELVPENSEGALNVYVSVSSYYS